MSAPTKKSATIALIGDDGGPKKDFLLFLCAAFANKSSDAFAKLDDTLPTAVRPIGSSFLYTITGPAGTILRILDTPQLSATHDENLTTGINKAIGTLVTIDAIVIIAGAAKEHLGDGVVQAIDSLRSGFPRSIDENICYLIMKIKESGYSKKQQPKGLPSGSKTFPPMDNVVAIRRQAQAAPVGEHRDGLREELEEDFKSTIRRAQRLFKYVEECSVQAWDMIHLYRRATEIESELYDSLVVGDTPVTADSKAIVSKLVDEYCLLAKSPDFATHLGLVVDVLRMKKGTESVDDSIRKLEKVRLEQTSWEQENVRKFPKGFVVC